MEEGRSDEKVRLGRITDASRSRREISLTFEPLWLRTPLPLTNDDIWKLRDALDIGDFEFSRNHVAVKDRDAISVLFEGAGYDIGDATRAHFKAKDIPAPHLTPTPEWAPPVAPTPPAAPNSSRSPNRVFVVHGKNEAARSSVVDHLRDLGLDPIVLHDQPNMGRYLLTKFIQEAELVTFAVVVMNDDDIGGVSKNAPRARQNVILELGYFIAHLGQDRVCALVTPGLETPSDFDGIVSIRMDSEARWRRELTRFRAGTRIDET